MVKKQRIYAIYDDDKFVDVGTKEELSERLAINEYDDNYDEDNAEVCIEVIRRLIEQEEF
ncbi:hypothetical protein B7935_10725 [Streptococcus agalactiae]|nr:hypothetical protein [Streptococcus agalactiae]OTG44029.1 hypothetical protein B7935_10725 [Streptococcus agalactiae]